MVLSNTGMGLSAYRRFAFSLAFAVLLAGQNAVAGQALDRSVDAYVRSEMGKRRIPGLALAVIQHGRVEKTSSYGLADLAFDIPVTPTTLFNVKSETKAFTAVAVMTLVEAGKLKLDDHIGTYLNELPASWREITIRQLLDHTSGVPDVARNSYSTETVADTPEEALRVLSDRPMDFAPGSQWRYNQTNYLLLGLLIEKLSGESYSRFCEDRLFAPLKLNNPTFGDERTVIRHRATDYTIYRFAGDAPTVLDHFEVLDYRMPPMLYPAGGLNISAVDLAHWLIAIMSEKLISRASLQELWTPTRLNDGSTFEEPPSSPWRNYGLGWLLVPQAEHPAVGGTGGVQAAFIIYPKDDFAVAVLTNLQGSQPDSLVVGIASQYLAQSNHGALLRSRPTTAQ